MGFKEKAERAEMKKLRAEANRIARGRLEQFGATVLKRLSDAGSAADPHLVRIAADMGCGMTPSAATGWAMWFGPAMWDAIATAIADASVEPVSNAIDGEGTAADPPGIALETAAARMNSARAFLDNADELQSRAFEVWHQATVEWKRAKREDAEWRHTERLIAEGR